jgi:hypothetical protein
MQFLFTLQHFYNKGNKKAGRIIHDIYFWGGAAVMNPSGKIEEIHHRATVCGIANGRVNNCYSKKDYILKYAFVGQMSKFNPIGLVPIFEEIPS